MSNLYIMPDGSVVGHKPVITFAREEKKTWTTISKEFMMSVYMAKKKYEMEQKMIKEAQASYFNESMRHYVEKERNNPVIALHYYPWYRSTAATMCGINLFALLRNPEDNKEVFDTINDVTIQLIDIVDKYGMTEGKRNG